MYAKMNHHKIAAIFVIFAAIPAFASNHARAGIILAMNSPDDSGFNSLVSNLRKNPVNVNDLLSPPHDNPPVVSARMTPKPVKVARAKTTSSSEAPELTVDPYTDSFFSSKVSPY